MKRRFFGLTFGVAVGLLAGFGSFVPGLGGTAAASEGERMQVTGEIMDTWCYVSGIMGGPEAVTGTAHHNCALWCAAGGIPVGVLADDGTIYMVLKFEGDATSNANPAVMEIQSNRVSVDGTVYSRDGINYLIVDQVIANEGITNRNHDDFGVVPPFAVPEQ